MCSCAMSGETNMKWLAVPLLCVFAIASVPSASAKKNNPAPAPVIGSGIPAVLIIGGVLLGAQLLGRRKQKD